MSTRLQESLRKYSVVPVVVRHLSADDELEGHPIPAGTTVICHLQVRSCCSNRTVAMSYMRQAVASRRNHKSMQLPAVISNTNSVLSAAGGAPHMEVARLMATSALHARGRIRLLRRGHPPVHGGDLHSSVFCQVHS